ncbi:MAG: TraM recognition domain-containing protein, partial [Bacteroidota bacterium]
MNLETPLIHFSEQDGDVWTIRDAFEGVQIFGGIGSGKTSGSGKKLAKAFLMHGFGGLVHCAKPEEKDTWIQYAKETGRLDDLIIFEEGSEYYFNPLEYENTREGKGAGEVFNLSNLFMEIYKMGNRFSGGGSSEKDRYWDNALRRSLNRMILLLKSSGHELSIGNMVAIMESIPTEEIANSLADYSDEDWNVLYNSSFCLECIIDMGGILAKKRETLEELEEKENKNIDEEILLASLEEEVRLLDEYYNICYSYFLNQFATADEKTKSIVRESFLGLAEPFTMGILKKYFAGDLTIKPDMSWQGKIIILNFSVKEYLDSGMYAQGIFKYLWQQAIERRDTTKYPLPCFLWVDESQYFVNEYDTIFQTTARSSRAATVFITQNISNYYAQMGGEASKSKVNSLLGNLSTKVFHANNDAVTNEWASNVIGKGIINLKSEGENRKNFHFLADTRSTTLTPHVLPQVLPL